MSPHLPSWVAVVELVLVPESKLLWEPFLYLFVCQLLTLSLQGEVGRRGGGGGGKGGDERRRGGGEERRCREKWKEGRERER